MTSRLWIGLLVAGVVLGGACVGYPVAKMRWSSRQVHAFCDEVRVGGPIEGLKPRAEQRGLNVIESPARLDQPEKLIAWQGWVFSRHLCEVHGAGGIVTEKRTSALD